MSYDIAYMQNLKIRDTNGLIYLFTKQKQAHRLEKTELMVTWREVWWGRDS